MKAFLPPSPADLQRGVFQSPADLRAAINRYLGEHNRKTLTVCLDRRLPISEKSIMGIKRWRHTTTLLVELRGIMFLQSVSDSLHPRESFFFKTKPFNPAPIDRHR